MLSLIVRSHTDIRKDKSKNELQVTRVKRVKQNIRISDQWCRKKERRREQSLAVSLSALLLLHHLLRLLLRPGFESVSQTRADKRAGGRWECVHRKSCFDRSCKIIFHNER
jgi:hypothetical protein